MKFPDLWPVNKILLTDVLGSLTWGHTCWLEPLLQTSISDSYFSPAPNQQEVATEERDYVILYHQQKARMLGLKSMHI